MLLPGSGAGPCVPSSASPRDDGGKRRHRAIRRVRPSKPALCAPRSATAHHRIVDGVAWKDQASDPLRVTCCLTVRKRAEPAARARALPPVATDPRLGLRRDATLSAIARAAAAGGGRQEALPHSAVALREPKLGRHRLEPRAQLGPSANPPPGPPVFQPSQNNKTGKGLCSAPHRPIVVRLIPVWWAGACAVKKKEEARCQRRAAGTQRAWRRRRTAATSRAPRASRSSPTRRRRRPRPQRRR